MTLHGIDLDSASIRAFCRKWKIKELCVFGSALRDDFGPDSDIDLLFTLEDRSHLTLDSWLEMEEELKKLLEREVDLVPRHSIEESDNYIRRRHILSTAEPIYAER